MATVLITCCPYDPSTRYGYYYLKKLAKILARHNHKVVILRSAVLSKFNYALAKYDPDLVILNGHGGSKGVTGCNDHVILGVKTYDKELGIKITRQNPEWMSGRIVYLFTCHAGKELAYRLVNYGAVAVAAFREAYIFLSQNERSIDHEAYPFFDAALQLPILLAGGFTFGEGCQAVRESFREYRAKAEERGDELEAKYLNHNLKNFVSVGYMDVKL